MITMINFLNLELARFGVTAEVQVGIHSGPAIAGVIGHKAFQYDLCGDAVNTAARMCSYSLPGHVHVSETTHALLSHRFAAVCRGEREIKGKGKMKTYFLTSLPAAQTEVRLGHAAESTLPNPALAPPPGAQPESAAPTAAATGSGPTPSAVRRSASSSRASGERRGVLASLFGYSESSATSSEALQA